MSMPKGFKTRKGYATITEVPNGMDYRAIAEEMTSRGDKMNHATARNVFLKAMLKLAEPMHKLYQLECDEATLTQTAKDPEFQSGMIDMINDLGFQSGERKIEDANV